MTAQPAITRCRWNSNGVVTLTDIDVDGGGLRDYGVWVNNSTGVKTGVTMKISGIWNNNDVTNFQVEGIYIQSSGQVTLDELFLDYNPLGLYVNTGGGVTVTDSEVRHQTNGMQIIAGGAVVLTNIYSQWMEPGLAYPSITARLPRPRR